IAALGIAVVANLPDLQKNEAAKKTVAPQSEPIALIPRTEEPLKAEPAVPPEPVKPIRQDEKPPIEKKSEPPVKKTDEPKEIVKVDPKVKKGDEPKAIAKVDPEPKKKDPAVPEPKKDVVKVEPKKEPAKLVRVDDNLAKLADPEGEFVVKSLYGARRVQLIGTIKTLKIADVNERSTLDLSMLEADEIIITGNINGGSKVILGQAKTLRLRDVNNQSTVDASALGARHIVVAGSINGGSTIKLHAPKGTVEFLGEVNDRSTVEIAAPEGKVVFKGRGNSVINGGTKLHITARELDFAGAINGPDTGLDVTLTRGAVLTVWRISGGVRFHYRKAEATDPDPRVDAGPTAGADFRLVSTPKK
ncbi:MAG: hypothetical protein HYR84_03935, partial [Planctomycetes bacterium]|nr:hypothetical protein [Planctomycetota bacterium]